jgi:hypothetical protein
MPTNVTRKVVYEAVHSCSVIKGIVYCLKAEVDPVSRKILWPKEEIFCSQCGETLPQEIA